MRSWHAPRTSSWLMWSSPLLLVVLVLTLTASSNAAKSPPHASVTRVHATTTTTATTATTATTTTTTTATSHRARRHATKPSPRAPSTRSSTTVSPATSSTTTIPPRSDGSSSSAIDASAPTIASASGERAANGVIDGELNASLSASAVPLLGPGRWTLVASAPLHASLSCAQQSVAVQGAVVVGAGQSCQLLLVATNPRVLVTWQLDPIS